MYYGRYTPALALIAIVLGIGLALNCLKGLRSGEGMYDSGSTQYMYFGQIAGIIVGLGAAAWGAIYTIRILALLF